MTQMHVVGRYDDGPDFVQARVEVEVAWECMQKEVQRLLTELLGASASSSHAASGMQPRNHCLAIVYGCSAHTLPQLCSLHITVSLLYAAAVRCAP